MLGRMRPLLLALCLTALPLVAAPADEPVSPSQFRDYAQGWTLHFSRHGEPFGQETFKPGRHTVWRNPDGSCMNGVWRPYGARLCFYYGEGDQVSCWRALRDDKGLYVKLLGDGPDAGLELRVTGRDKARPLCGAPGRAI